MDLENNRQEAIDIIEKVNKNAKEIRLKLNGYKSHSEMPKGSSS